MLNEATKQRLQDPDYLDLHLAAVASIAKIGSVPWYDSHFLRRFEAAKHYLSVVRPDAVDRFVEGFAPFLPQDDFKIRTIDSLFDEKTHRRIVEVARSLPDDDRLTDELEEFGRQIYWDHPDFLELQQQILPLVCELAGRDLVTGYNFLSLYGPDGKCDPHMDEPSSMYTLDYCIEQSDEWPIYFSKIVPWPTIETIGEWRPADVLDNPDLKFAEYVLQPNQALLFNGSSQWHYRKPKRTGGFCNLLFFHYYPAGCDDLVLPLRWADHFDIPELRAICELFRADTTDGLT